MYRTVLTLVALGGLAVPGTAVATSPPAPAPGATANGSLVPQGSIRGVKVGMTLSQVRERLGSPGSDRATRHPILGLTRTLGYGRLTVTFDGRASTSPVTAVMTESSSDRTAAGLGVGSTERQLRSGLKGLKCEKSLGYRTCTLGVLRPGRLVTDFSLTSSGRVKRVTLGRVID
jgi:hypothetical protein